MNILICGLGLIGASLAKQIKKNTSHIVLGWNRTKSVTEKALRDGAIDKTGDIDDLISQADIPRRLFLLSWSTGTVLSRIPS